MDREQKIAEIREALDVATPGPWEIADTTDGYVLLDADGRELAFCDSVGRADDARFIANAPGWLRFLLDELDRLRAERDSHGPEGRNYTNKQYVDLLAERDKLIEGLRWYAGDQYGSVRFSPPIPDIPILHDCGQRARDILKEIGVTVE